METFYLEMFSGSYGAKQKDNKLLAAVLNNKCITLYKHQPFHTSDLY